MTNAFDGGPSRAREIDREFLETIEPAFVSLCRQIEHGVEALEKSHPRRHSTALNVLARNARRTGALVGQLAYVVPRLEALAAERVHESDYGHRISPRKELMRRIARIVAANEGKT